MARASRETERIVKQEIARLPADGTFLEVPRDHHAFELPLTLVPTRAWKSRAFVVQLFLEGDYHRLSVQRSGANAYIRPGHRDERPISWDELLAVKRAVGFGEAWAVEVYPPDSEVVDVALKRHLWLLPAAPAFAWRGNHGS